MTQRETLSAHQAPNVSGGVSGRDVESAGAEVCLLQTMSCHLTTSDRNWLVIYRD